MNPRLLANLVAVAAVSVVLVLYAVVDLLAGAVVDHSYPVAVRLPESGGLLAGQEVTVNGRVVGEVADVVFDGDGVAAHLSVDHGEQLPSDAVVVVQRRSPIGEQAIDLRPQSPDAPPVEPGTVLDPEVAETPVEVQGLLELADELLEGVDTDDAATLVTEFADTFRGRGDDVAAVLRDAGRLSATVARSDAELDRFFGSGRAVSEELRDHRGALTAAIAGVADTAAVLADVRPDLEGLLVDAPPLLSEVSSVVGRGRADLACVLDDLASTAVFFSQPGPLGDVEGALRHNRWFFEGIAIGSTPDATSGDYWNRVRVLPPQREGESYLPEKRPIQPIRPGGPCASPFGPGAGAATQPGWAPIAPEAEVRPPG